MIKKIIVESYEKTLCFCDKCGKVISKKEHDFYKGVCLSCSEQTTLKQVI